MNHTLCIHLCVSPTKWCLSGQETGSSSCVPSAWDLVRITCVPRFVFFLPGREWIQQKVLNPRIVFLYPCSLFLIHPADWHHPSMFTTGSFLLQHLPTASLRTLSSKLMLRPLPNPASKSISLKSTCCQGSQLWSFLSQKRRSASNSGSSVSLRAGSERAEWMDQNETVVHLTAQVLPKGVRGCGRMENGFLLNYQLRKCDLNWEESRESEIDNMLSGHIAILFFCKKFSQEMKMLYSLTQK